jgi:uncharacterized membrane protein
VNEIGPVEYMIVAFPGNKFKGEIAPALADLVDSNTIRVIDLAFVIKNGDGDVAALEITDLEPDVRSALEKAGGESGGLLNEDDLMAAAEELEPNSSAALIVWEDVWAAKLAEAIRSADGVVLDLERIPREVVTAAREWALANS